jgi:hypothetical protein
MFNETGILVNPGPEDKVLFWSGARTSCHPIALRLRTTDWKSVADRENALKRVVAPLQQASACFL